MNFGAGVSLVLAVCLSVILLVNTWRKMAQRKKLPPGPTPFPLLGNLLQMKSGGMVKFLRSLQETYGPVFTVHIGSRPLVVICGYDAVKEAFIDHGDAFLGRGAVPLYERMFHGSGLSLANNQSWKKLRQFTLKTLKDVGMGKRTVEDKLQEEAQCMVERFRNTKGELCDPSFGIDSAAANVIFAMVFGERFDYQDEKFHSLLKSMSDAFVIMNSIWGQLYDYFPAVMYHLPGPHNRMFKHFMLFEEQLKDQVRSHQETLDSNSPRDFIDSYLIKMEQEKQNVSTEFNNLNLIPTIMDLILSGIEPISTTVRYGLLFLLKYPLVQGKIHEEIDCIIGQHRSPAYEDRVKMPYTNAVIHEIQRFCHIFPVGFPHLVTRNTQLKGMTIPKGTDVLPFLSTVLKDPTQFKDPHNFNPENFLDENGAFKKANAYVPFSIGKRNCPGEGMTRMEMFLLITILLQNFILKSPLNPNDIGLENLPQKYKVSFVPRNGRS